MKYYGPKCEILLNQKLITFFDNYDEKYITIKFNLDDDVPLMKTLELRNMIVVARFFMRTTNTDDKNDIAISNICKVDYSCIIKKISKSEAANVLQSAGFS